MIKVLNPKYYSVLSVIAIFIISIIGILSAFGYCIAPDSTENANQMHITLPNKPMGYRVDFIQIPIPDTPRKTLLSSAFTGKKIHYEEIPITNFTIKNNLIKSYTTFLGEQKKIEKKLSREAIKHKTFYLGTDKYGRDFLSRIIVGARISFFAGFMAVFISLLIGVPLGAIAGYFGGKADNFIMWIINIIWSIPTLLFVIALTLALGKGFFQVFIAIGCTMWVEVARITRGQFISLRQKEFVEATRAIGLSNFRIIFNHIMPNAWGPVIVVSAANFAAAILIESGLSFLGIGAQPPTPSWGSTIKEHYSQIILGNAHLAIVPGLCIMLLVLSFMILGNRLRDKLDSRN